MIISVRCNSCDEIIECWTNCAGICPNCGEEWILMSDDIKEIYSYEDLQNKIFTFKELLKENELC